MNVEFLSVWCVPGTGKSLSLQNMVIAIADSHGLNVYTHLHSLVET
jgi:hypothetical protein